MTGAPAALVERLTNLARLKPALRKPFVAGLVEMCRKANLNVSKDTATYIVGLAWSRGIYLGFSGAAEWRSMNQPTPKEPAHTPPAEGVRQ